MVYPRILFTSNWSIPKVKVSGQVDKQMVKQVLNVIWLEKLRLSILLLQKVRFHHITISGQVNVKETKEGQGVALVGIGEVTYILHLKILASDVANGMETLMSRDGGPANL